MEKKRLPKLPWRQWKTVKFLLLMKLTFTIILIATLHVAARGYGQEARITLNVKDVPIGKVLQSIERNTDYKFVYADNFFASDIRVSVDVKQAPVSYILTIILEKTGFTFRRMDDLIIITTNGHTALLNPVKGTVHTSKGVPMESVTVALEGSNNKTLTDQNGAFTIEVPDNNAVLIFTFVGYTALRLPVGKKSSFDIVLEESIRDLSEVLVVGYGMRKKREITSAITRVNAEDFNKGNISDVAQLLQGKVAGLSISRPGGNPNGDFTLRLRGLSTLGANAQPLIVVDDQVGADLNTVDPNDIKSIDVLKDGSAAAIYGTRGSAGVIIITTKKGLQGSPQINYNASGTAETAAKFTKHMDAAEYRKLGTGNDYGSTTDWNKEITRTAWSHAHNISLSAGSKGTSYNASLNFRNNEGVAINTGNQQLNGRFNIVQKALQDRLTLNMNLNLTKRKADFGNTAAFKWATIYNPTAPVHSKDPKYDITGGGYFENAGILDYFNPVAALTQNINEGETNRLNYNGSAEYEILPGLKLLGRYSQQTTAFSADAYSPRQALSGGGFQKRGLASQREDKSFNQLFESILTYNKSYNKFSYNLLAGYSYQDFLNKGFSIGAGDFLTDDSHENLSSSLDFKNGLSNGNSYKSASRLIAFFGRVGINYDNLAFLQASVRREGSSMFGANHQWGNFPAVSAGIDFGRFMKTTPFNNLKLRASYGITGALPPRPYLSIERITNQGGTYYAGNGNYLQTYATFVNPNPDLKWERKNEVDIGLDFSVFNSRLSGSIDYFNRTTKDLIFNLTVPSPPNLNPTTWKNIGEIKNHGIEISVNYDMLRGKNFSWSSGANFSTFHIVLSKLDESLKDSYVGASSLGSPGFSGLQVTRAVAGQPIGILWGLKYVGLDAAGKYLFDDGQGKPVAFYKAKEMVLGNGLPKFEFGWNNTFRYHNFDVNFFLRGSIGHQLINSYRAFYETPTLVGYNIVNTKFYNPALKDGKKFSSLEVEKASFAKLDNATIGYNFPVKPAAGKTPWIRNFRVYFSAQNLFIITGYTGVDPEVRYTDVNDDGSTNLLAPGVDRRETWIYTRAFTFGLNIGL